MNVAVRSALIVLAFIGVLAVALVYPALARGEAWQSAVWMHPWWLLLAAPIPFVVWRMTLGHDRRVPVLSFPTVAPLLAGPRGWRTRIRDLPGILRGAALAMAVLALARPQNVLRGESAEERGIDIVVVLDLSGSMRAVMDAPGGMAPAPSPGARQGRRATRLDTAKDVIVDFISRRKTDRIGVVVFGRAAFVLSPPTLDYALLTGLVQKMEL